MDVTFATARGRRFTIEVGYFDTVMEMKEKILKYEGIPVASQRLFFHGQELLDHLDTEHYSILHGSLLLLLLPHDAPPADCDDDAPTPCSSRIIHLLVSIPAIRRQLPLDVDASDTVARVKELLQDHTDGALPAARQALFYDKTELQDQKALAEYEPPEQMEVTAAVRQPQPQPQMRQQQQGAAGRMAVVVKCGGRTVSVEVSGADNVGELRKELQGGRMSPQLGFRLPAEGGYFFIYKQNVMEEERSFRWHDVKHGDTIEIFNGSVTGGS